MAEDPQKRASRACDACKVKRVKCESVLAHREDQQSCKGCQEIGQHCLFEAPVRRRGPAIGFKRKRRSGFSVGPAHETHSLSSPPPRAVTSSRPRDTTPIQSREHLTASSSRFPTPDYTLHEMQAGPRSSMNRDAPLLGLPRPMVDELLTAYFTHVHNVWPLIYKPAFTPYNVSPLLLCSMLAISACVSPPSSASGFDARKLYRMAESILHRSGGGPRIDVVQALILLSLTQTGCGDKGAAFICASRAVGMILNMGLNLARVSDISTVEAQIRSRVFWNCYVLDKSLSEETGRSYLLPYRRCSTPFPSLDEVDELEVWPPVSTSSAPLPRCVSRLTPRRGHVISCFIWTCRLAMVVEDILDLDSVSVTGQCDWDRQFRDSGLARRGNHDEAHEALRIEEQLNRWKEMLPVHLTPDDPLSPLPHVSIGLAWHATATIMLHSRFVVRMPSDTSLPAEQSHRAARAHKICSDAARQTVDILRSLDKFGLLEQISSDAIHILSLATLFDAFDMTNTDTDVAARAKEDFTQCCAWLRHFSSMWPAASAHKLFFEAVVQGGLQLADPEAGNEDRASPLRHTASLSSPSLTGGLQAVRRHLSVSEPSNLAGTDSSSAGVGGMLQIPHFFWNQLSTAANTSGIGSATDPVGQDLAWDDMFNFEDTTITSSANGGLQWGSYASGLTAGNSRLVASLEPLPWSVPINTGVPYPPNSFPQGLGVSAEIQSDQAAISSALINFIADMTRTKSPKQNQ